MAPWWGHTDFQKTRQPLLSAEVKRIQYRMHLILRSNTIQYVSNRYTLVHAIYSSQEQTTMMMNRREQRCCGIRRRCESQTIGTARGLSTIMHILSNCVWTYQKDFMKILGDCIIIFPNKLSTTAIFKARVALWKWRGSAKSTLVIGGLSDVLSVASYMRFYVQRSLWLGRLVLCLYYEVCMYAVCVSVCVCLCVSV